ncbi:pre-60S ribosomal particles component [Komagataella phaffii CBS 7435]|nr:pre-60S ribosomal particles component [Komagataella phaffii CBS 7435]CCA40230.1 pre-60S ribosomal particles component [Komagataella phaffii CBS 7435]
MPNRQNLRRAEKDSEASVRSTGYEGPSTCLSKPGFGKGVSLEFFNHISDVNLKEDSSIVGKAGFRPNSKFREVLSDEEDSNSPVEMDFEEVSTEDSEELDLSTSNDKRTKSTDGSDRFSKAVTSILDSKLKAYDRKDPILARSKKGIKKLEEEKLEKKAMRLILQEKKERLKHSRNEHILPTDDDNVRAIIERERFFKKIAQKGAIRLFNAILATQVKTHKTMEDTKTEILGRDARKRVMTEVSKDNFLDMIQRAGKST